MPRQQKVVMTMASVLFLSLVIDVAWRRELGGSPAVASSLEATYVEASSKDGGASLDLQAALRPRVSPAADRSSADRKPVDVAMTEAVAITVNGVDVVAVANEQAAQEVTSRIMAEYRATVLPDSSEVEQLAFQEELSTRPKQVAVDSVRTVDEAISILKRGTDQIATYVVQEGDTGWDIAEAYHVDLLELSKYNPGVDWSAMQIGQEINVTFKEPYVHMQSISKKLVTESIPFTERIVDDAELWPWQHEVVTPGKAGQRQLTIREYREDGRVVNTEVLDNTVATQPKVQVTKRGTKQVPAMGSGSLAFPTKGSLSSYYGARWGTYHYGIDVAAPEGTSVLAADSGMVIFSGWSGNYGKLIQVDHGNGMVTWYAHLSGYNAEVGDEVGKGAVIGYVGDTGYSTGAHLHFEVHVNDKPVNPLNYYK